VVKYRPFRYDPYERLVRCHGRQRLQYAARNVRTGEIECVGSSRSVREHVQNHGYWHREQNTAA